MLRAAARRILAILAAVVGATAAISAALGALAGKDIDHAIAVGFYLVGAAVLVGSFVLGVRGPLRPDRGDEDGTSPVDLSYSHMASPFRRRRLRKASAEERMEYRRNSLALFVFGLLLVVIGALVDPSRRAF